MATHVFTTMGTAVSIRVPGYLPGRDALAAVEACFASFDEQFSLYRPDSEISRLARAELPLPAASERMRDLYAEALRWRSITRDCFTPHRPDGVIDLSGIVKAEAMAGAGRVLLQHGCSDWLLNVGGDILAAGQNAGSPWRLGVVDPDDRQHLLCTFDLDAGRTALATSGTAERGEHVWRSEPRARYHQVTVVADDIVTADVWATAILAGGPDSLDVAVSEAGVDVIAVDETGQVMATERMRRAHGFVAV